MYYLRCVSTQRRIQNFPGRPKQLYSRYTVVFGLSPLSPLFGCDDFDDSMSYLTVLLPQSIIVVCLMISLSRTPFSQIFRVRVSGLPWGAKSEDILSSFNEFGPTDATRVTSETGKDLGQTLVSFPSVEQAIEASQTMNGSYFVGSGSVPPRRMTVSCDFRGPRVVRDVMLPRTPNPRRLIKLIRDKAVGAKWPNDPVMASTNESRMLRRYKTGGLPRAHDRQR